MPGICTMEKRRQAAGVTLCRPAVGSLPTSRYARLQATGTWPPEGQRGSRADGEVRGREHNTYGWSS